ncbi:MAG TPA: hypothetical protein V6D50_01110 [Chroococcales cyanobacterium]
MVGLSIFTEEAPWKSTIAWFKVGRLGLAIAFSPLDVVLVSLMSPTETLFLPVMIC